MGIPLSFFWKFVFRNKVACITFTHANTDKSVGKTEGAWGKKSDDFLKLNFRLYGVRESMSSKAKKAERGC